MNLRPSGYEPDELPGCSIPRRCIVLIWYWFSDYFAAHVCALFFDAYFMGIGFDRF
ncbi:hypothetical protein RV134_290007 [Roseovarius sp. EC-HK134]|nr:hypothetical protein RV420_280001 [Roseovarius sp. EC-SD190]VVT17258.1 hypothetical protein RV134_290007 [Roseovarius sp. EC-HK134]VVT17624.1 hypothetical protein RV420_350026 [Roseovarius sp. EC-SD190]VVT17679.1 hypothetical protein RV420_360001 [Roseovarius sp. EC-SD190]